MSDRVPHERTAFCRSSAYLEIFVVWGGRDPVGNRWCQVIQTWSDEAEFLSAEHLINLPMGLNRNK